MLMSYRVERHPDLPAIIIAFMRDFDLANEGVPAIQAALHLLDTQAQPVFLISEMNMPPPSFDELIYATNLSTRQLELFKHSNVRENIFVTTNTLISLAAKGANSPLFGHLKINVLPTLETALTYVQGAITGDSAQT